LEATDAEIYCARRLKQLQPNFNSQRVEREVDIAVVQEEVC